MRAAASAGAAEVEVIEAAGIVPVPVRGELELARVAEIQIQRSWQSLHRAGAENSQFERESNSREAVRDENFESNASDGQ